MSYSELIREVNNNLDENDEMVDGYTKVLKQRLSIINNHYKRLKRLNKLIENETFNINSIENDINTLLYKICEIKDKEYINKIKSYNELISHYQYRFFSEKKVYDISVKMNNCDNTINNFKLEENDYKPLFID